MLKMELPKESGSAQTIIQRIIVEKLQPQRSFKLRIKCQKTVLAWFYIWLFINNCPIETQRILGSRLLHKAAQSRSFERSFGSRFSRNNGLTPLETIALIQAINSNSPRGGDRTAQILELDKLPSRPSLRSSTSQNGIMRQAPPLPTSPLTAFLAALAALAAAIFTGATPLAAILLAAIAAILAALPFPFPPYPPFPPFPPTPPYPPIVKKLIIKKTVLPFVIPIPIKKKETIIKYVPKSGHHSHHESEDHEHVGYYKHKKFDEAPKRKDASMVIRKIAPKPNHLDKLENLVQEQDNLQKLVDKAVDEQGYKSSLGQNIADSS